MMQRSILEPCRYSQRRVRTVRSLSGAAMSLLCDFFLRWAAIASVEKISRFSCEHGDQAAAKYSKADSATTVIFLSLVGKSNFRASVLSMIGLSDSPNFSSKDQKKKPGIYFQCPNFGALLDQRLRWSAQARGPYFRQHCRRS